jgi:hypothetical protein
MGERRHAPDAGSLNDDRSSSSGAPPESWSPGLSPSPPRWYQVPLAFHPWPALMAGLNHCECPVESAVCEGGTCFGRRDASMIGAA